MKIAFFTDSFLPQINGIATSIANFARELGRQGHDVMIFAPDSLKDPNEKFIAHNVSVVYLPSVPVFIYPDYKMGAFGFPKIVQKIRKFNPDIIHFHTPLFVGMDSVVLAKLLKKPLIGTMHTNPTTPEHLKWLNNNLLIGVASDFLENSSKYLYNKCNLILCPSQLLLNQLKDAGYTPPIEHLSNAVNIDPVLIRDSIKNKESLKKSLGLKNKVILHFGRISPEKNVDSVIDAFSQLLKSHTDVSLLIIGDGPARKSLKEKAQNLGISENVVFTGFIAHEKLIKEGYIALGDFFVTASPVENQPMVILEAMSYGLPIVAIKEAGVIEMLSDNGFLIQRDNIKELSEKMNLLLTDSELRDTMGKRSYEIAQKYTVQNVTTELLTKYEALLKKAPKSASI